MQMCPDPELKNVKGLLEIKEDWPPAAFHVTEKPEASIDRYGVFAHRVSEESLEVCGLRQARQIVVQEHVKDVDTQGNFRGLPLGFTTAGGKFLQVQ